jgi:hypothetical protein
MQVGIIPFVKNGFTKNIYPMKINQYLAYGMPVVTTDFADLSDFGDLIYYSTADKFVNNLEIAINEKKEITQEWMAHLFTVVLLIRAIEVKAEENNLLEEVDVSQSDS